MRCVSSLSRSLHSRARSADTLESVMRASSRGISESVGRCAQWPALLAKRIRRQRRQSALQARVDLGVFAAHHAAAARQRGVIDQSPGALTTGWCEALTDTLCILRMQVHAYLACVHRELFQALPHDSYHLGRIRLQLASRQLFSDGEGQLQQLPFDVGIARCCRRASSRWTRASSSCTRVCISACARAMPAA
jgi:hypothetical protein